MKAKRLAEAERKILQDEYFAHAEKAMDNLRAAKAGDSKNAAALKTEDAAEKLDVRYAIDKGFERGIDQLDTKTADYMITVGTTSEALKSIGVKNQTILWNVGKIWKILSKHSDGMTVDIIKQVPQVLEHPVVILHSNEEIGAQQGKNYGGRIYTFGEVTDAKGNLVSVSLELLPTRKSGLLMDNIVITSAYGKSNVQNALNTDQILYVDPNKKRTAAWLGSTGLQLPVPPTMYGSMGKITYFGESVKMMKPDSRNAKLAQFMEQTDADRTNEPVKKSVRYQINPEYAQDIENWNREGRPDEERFILGSTGNTLQRLGAKTNDIYMNSTKINTILREHPEMTLEEIKRIPEILDDPVMVLTSQNKGRTKQNTRLVMFGSVKAQDGRPILCVLDLRPVENHIVLNDMQKVTSAYTKDVKPVQFVENSEALYVSENKEKTTELLRTLGFKIPSELQSYGFMGSITYTGQNIKLDGVKFTEIEPTEKSVRFQRAEQADREAKKNTQRQASRVIADNAAAIETLRQMMGLTRGVRISEDSILGKAEMLVKASGAKGKADTEHIAREMRTLIEYMKTEGADMNKAQGLAETIAGEILDSATYRNTELWQQYPEYHELTYTVNKSGQAK